MNLMAPLREIYYAASACWGMFAAFTCFFLYFIPREFGFELLSSVQCAAATVVPPALLLIATRVPHAGPRWIVWMPLLAGISFFPVLSLLLTFDFLYLFYAPANIRLPIALTTAATILVWCCWRLVTFSHLVAQRRFIQREFSIEDTKIVVSQPQRTSLEPKLPKKESLATKLFGHVVPYIAAILPIAYPFQRAIGHDFGDGGVLLFLALLSFPLTLHVASRMTCGAYLWIYWPLKLSLQHKKPVYVE